MSGGEFNGISQLEGDLKKALHSIFFRRKKVITVFSRVPREGFPLSVSTIPLILSAMREFPREKVVQENGLIMIKESGRKCADFLKDFVQNGGLDVLVDVVNGVRDEEECAFKQIVLDAWGWIVISIVLNHRMFCDWSRWVASGVMWRLLDETMDEEIVVNVCDCLMIVWNDLIWSEESHLSRRLVPSIDSMKKLNRKTQLEVERGIHIPLMHVLVRHERSPEVVVKVITTLESIFNVNDKGIKNFMQDDNIDRVLDIFHLFMGYDHGSIVRGVFNVFFMLLMREEDAERRHYFMRLILDDMRKTFRIDKRVADNFCLFIREIVHVRHLILPVFQNDVPLVLMDILEQWHGTDSIKIVAWLLLQDVISYYPSLVRNGSFYLRIIRVVLDCCEKLYGDDDDDAGSLKYAMECLLCASKDKMNSQLFYMHGYHRLVVQIMMTKCRPGDPDGDDDEEEMLLCTCLNFLLALSRACGPESTREILKEGVVGFITQSIREREGRWKRQLSRKVFQSARSGFFP